MTVFRHEMKQGRISFMIWTSAIAFLLVVCVLLFPEMKGEMANVGDMFASMGSFTEAFGMDQVNFGELKGFYAVECGNVLGLGGAFFAALTAVGMLAKEEKDHTAEFLLTHPVSRKRVLTGKLLAVFAQLVIMNIVIYGAAVFSMVIIKEAVPWKEVTLLHVAYFLLQIEIAAICFCISAFLRRGGMGIGLGLATVFYFFNLIANIADSAKWLKYVTPFGYTEGSDIMSTGVLEADKIAIGIICAAVSVVIAFRQYSRKDIS